VSTLIMVSLYRCDDAELSDLSAQCPRWHSDMRLKKPNPDFVEIRCCDCRIGNAGRRLLRCRPGAAFSAWFAVFDLLGNGGRYVDPNFEDNLDSDISDKY